MTAGQHEQTATKAASLLDLEDVVPFLAGHGLLSSDAFLEAPNLHVEDRTRRNRNYIVKGGGGPNLLVKQAGQLGMHELVATSRQEAAILRAVQERKSLKPMRWFTPEFHFYDERASVLVVEAIHPVTSFSKLHLNAGNPNFPDEVATAAGRILAVCHDRLKESNHQDPLSIPTRHPHAFQLLESIDQSARAGVQIMAEFHEALSTADIHAVFPDPTNEWVAAGPIHGDIRWDNFLISSGSGPAANPNIRLTDWELAFIGDPAWDVACYIGEYHRFWWHSRTTTYQPLAPNESRVDLEAMAPSANAFLRAYAKRRRLNASREEALRTRVASYLPWVVLGCLHESLQTRASLSPATIEAVALLKHLTSQGLECRSWFPPGGTP